MNYLARRLMTFPLVMLGVSILVFVSIRLVPGDAITAMLGTEAGLLTPDQRAALEAYFGIDQGWFTQYWRWLAGAVQGDLGVSVTFGKPVLDNQVVHFRLGELRTEVEALRALTWSAVEQYVAGRDVTRLASMAKLKCGRLMREVADSCLQYWGGMGYTRDNPVSRAFRDGRLASIGGGADEVMLGIIAKLEGTAPGTSNRR